MNKRITDLDKFAKEEIYLPFQTLIPLPRNETEPYLVWAMRALEDNSPWKRTVLNRITRIGFYFPEYIKHPLVDHIRAVEKGGE